VHRPLPSPQGSSNQKWSQKVRKKIKNGGAGLHCGGPQKKKDKVVPDSGLWKRCRDAGPRKRRPKDQKGCSGFTKSKSQKQKREVSMERRPVQGSRKARKVMLSRGWKRGGRRGSKAVKRGLGGDLRCDKGSHSRTGRIQGELPRSAT